MPPAVAAAAANGKDNGESMQDEIGQLMGNGDEMVSNSMYEGSTKESKKAPEVIQIEEEYNALTSYDLVLRRGRCGRYFAKYVQKSIFEDCDIGNSDCEDDGLNDKNNSRKRRKRYYDLEEYLHADGTRGLSNFQGLLMRDQKYLRKNMHKVNTLFVKEYATKITKKQQLNPEQLRLENQISVGSIVQDYAIGNGIGESGSNFDFDEGIRKYVKRVFDPILDVVQSTCPENDPPEKTLEEYK